MPLIFSFPITVPYPAGYAWNGFWIWENCSNCGQRLMRLNETVNHCYYCGLTQARRIAW